MTKLKPLNYAHRGFTQVAPENTLAAFEAAIELGADGIELDVRTCKSGEVIVLHDPTVARMTNGRGFVRSKTLQELRSLKILNEHNGKIERIPTLQEVIDLVAGQAVLNIEIKGAGFSKDNIEKKVIDILHANRIADTTIISSFNPIVIRRIGKLDSTLKTGLLVEKNFKIPNTELPLARLAGASGVHLKEILATETIIKKLRKFKRFCVVWDLNDPTIMKELFQWEVHGVITDKPDMFKNLQDAYFS